MIRSALGQFLRFLNGESVPKEMPSMQHGVPNPGVLSGHGGGFADGGRSGSDGGGGLS